VFNKNNPHSNGTNMAKKLYIYDSTSFLDVAQAKCRFNESVDLVTMPVASIQEFVGKLTALVQVGAKFDRALIQTHGGPGTIYVGHEALTSSVLRAKFSGKGFEALFPAVSRIYFDGCNIAAGIAEDCNSGTCPTTGPGIEGKTFLITAGAIFLKRAGGSVFAYASLGKAMPWWVPFKAGRTLHPGGGQVVFEFLPGGAIVPPSVPIFADPWGKDTKPWTSAKQ
jgi:hypothetical protein